MNKRIQELYKQAHITQEKQVRAGGWDNDREPFEYRTVTETNFDPEKFAELIVAECLKIVEPDQTSGDEWCVTLDETAQSIRQHFGIKE
jgi:hypothetical protein